VTTLREGLKVYYLSKFLHSAIYKDHAIDATCIVFTSEVLMIATLILLMAKNYGIPISHGLKWHAVYPSSQKMPH
jgi:hypothetical protein